MRSQEADATTNAQFVHEALNMADFVHPHIVPLLGVCGVCVGGHVCLCLCAGNSRAGSLSLSLSIALSLSQRCSFVRQGPPAMIVIELQPLGQLRDYLLRSQDQLRGTK